MALYPPIIESSMPAFNKNDSGVKIYFSISPYNTLNQIKHVQLTLRYQSNNVNALKAGVTNVVNDVYMAGNITLLTDTHRYYITLPKSVVDLTNSLNNWKADTLYKVQIRFSGIAANHFNADFLNNNLSDFSEWSTVCIIKPIIPPTFNITNIGDGGLLSSQFADFTMLYDPRLSSLTLKSWKIDFPLASLTSGWQTINEYKYNNGTKAISFTYSFPYEFPITTSSNKKVIKLFIKTKNNYLAVQQYQVYYSGSGNAFSNNTALKTFINEDEGYIKLQLSLHEATAPTSNNPLKIALRRSSSKSNFLKWETLKFINATGNGDYIYYDFTAESGIAYRYIIQKVINGIYYTAKPDAITPQGKATIAEWESAFLLETAGAGLLADIKQLKLQYDLQLSSWNINISLSKTDTIGSRYPYIRRNGNMYYRSFPISGTISAYMDPEELFISKDSLNDNNTSLYDNFKGSIPYYTRQYDFTYERKFRLAVELFLYNTKPKLYKSMQEGNILVKIILVSLAPKQELNRLIYTFSGTAYEIDDPTVQNYIKYGILNQGG